MRLLIFLLLTLLMLLPLNSQQGTTYQSGITAQENLRAISGLSPTSVGGMGFDSRYKGIRGSPMLFDTLLTSFLKVPGEEKYIEIESDIDIAGNSIRFLHPKTGQLLSLPANKVQEIILKRGNKDMIFRTIKGSDLNLKTEDHIFCQLLNNDLYQLIKVPMKEFTEADYKQAYSPGRQFDEYKTITRYFIITPGGSVHPVNLTSKSLARIFPGKKEQIRKTISGKKYTDKERMVIEVISSFR